MSGPYWPPYRVMRSLHRECVRVHSDRHDYSRPPVSAEVTTLASSPRRQWATGRSDDVGFTCRSEVVDGQGARQDEPVLGLEMVVVLGVALVACGALASRYPIAPA